MRLYGALSELAELIIRLASGKTVKVSASEQTAAGETIVTIPDVVDGADEFVMKDTQQTLTKKVLSGTVTTAGDTDKTSDMVITAADITANKIVMPSLQNNNDRPDDKNVKGAMHLSADTLVIVGNGTGYQTLVDMSSSQTLQQKTLNADVNSISNLNPAVSTTFKTVAGHADKVVKYDNSGVPQVAKIVNANIDDAAGIAGSKLSDNSVAAAKLASMTSADLAGKITDETGSGALVFANNPTIGSITAASGILSLSGTGALKIPAGTQAERPNSPVEGMIRYNSETDSFEGYASNAWSGIGGGGTVDRIAQLSHGFVVGDVLYLNGAVYAKAKADAANTAEVVGMVSRVIDVDNFEMTLSGEVAGLTGLTAGEVYFLSPSTAGALTVTEPSVVGQVSLPVGVASSTTSLYVAPKRGVVVGGANLRTQIGLNGAALVSQITTIQNVSAYEAGELAGWVTIDATTDYKFYVQAQFVKNSAGTDWNLAFQTTGETPPAGFSMNITTGGAIQVTLPPIAGFSSASINFALNAPAVGATLPLSIDASSITAGIIGTARLPQVSSSAQGAFPSLTSSLDNATATQLGLKQYFNGTNYNGGIAPTVTSGLTGFVAQRAVFIPYQTQDGAWRLKFNVCATFTSGSVVSVSFSINGITFFNQNVAYQALSGLFGSVNQGVRAYVGPNSSSVFMTTGSTVTADGLFVSGDVELNAKPTWAY